MSEGRNVYKCFRRIKYWKILALATKFYILRTIRERRLHPRVIHLPLRLIVRILVNLVRALLAIVIIVHVATVSLLHSIIRRRTRRHHRGRDAATRMRLCGIALIALQVSAPRFRLLNAFLGVRRESSDRRRPIRRGGRRVWRRLTRDVRNSRRARWRHWFPSRIRVTIAYGLFPVAKKSLEEARRGGDIRSWSLAVIRAGVELLMRSMIRAIGVRNLFGRSVTDRRLIRPVVRLAVGKICGARHRRGSTGFQMTRRRLDGFQGTLTRSTSRGARFMGNSMRQGIARAVHLVEF